jgi:SAM-dependent methyltransferase
MDLCFDFRFDSEEARLRNILEAQAHCDHFLTPLADVAGKSVLVVGAGAGTEVLWCLRHGARQVVAIDSAPQPDGALRKALAHLGLRGAFTVEHVGVHEAPERLGRRFEAVLANNVFEHVADLAGAFAACGRLLEAGGRAAIFSIPLYYSSRGAHLPGEPWEHLWADEEALRGRLLAGPLPPDHPLARMALRQYLDREITLNRARPVEFVSAASGSGLALLGLRLLPDEEIAQLPRYRARIAAAYPDLSILDLSTAGVTLELARLGEASVAALEATEPRTLRLRQAELEAAWRADVEVLHSVERSWSFRLGRVLTAPGRLLRQAGKKLLG